MRIVRIATTAFLVQDSPHSIDENLDRAVAYVARAAQNGADIVCLPEAVLTTHVPPDLTRYAEKAMGRCGTVISKTAKKHSIAIVAPYLVRAGRNIYNQATVFSRSGEIAGVYRKIQLNGSELDWISPGNTLPVFELEFGRVAVMICLDIYFPEIARIYSMKGAEILFFPTMTHGPTQDNLLTQVRARAMDNSIVLVESNFAGMPPYAPYAGRFHPATARIIDHNGDVIAQTGRRHGIVVADVDLDEVRLTSHCVLLNTPDRMREDLHTLVRADIYAREYTRLSATAASRGGKKNTASRKARRRQDGR